MKGASICGVTYTVASVRIPCILCPTLGILSEGLGKAPLKILLQKFCVPQSAFLHYLHSLDLTQLQEYQSKFFWFLLLVI